jgi:hypothetical protein
MSTSVFPFEVWPEGITQARIPANDNSLRSEVLAKAALTIADSEPVSPSEGDLHIVGTAWGDFSSDDVVIYKGGTWLGFEPFAGWLKYCEDDDKVYKYDGGWSEFAGGGGGGSDNTVIALTSSAGVVDIDLALGSYFTLTLTENITSITFSNLPGSGKGGTVMVQITQDSTPRSVTWPASFKWAGASAGAVSTANGAVDVLAITSFDNGAMWMATLANAFA